jgi:3-phenylpropionate/trans-cinnamate dioxygenase ferredoxin reductase subunit
VVTELSVVAVVGANLAGGRAAEALRRRGFAGRIVLFGEEPHAPYERPALSKAALSQAALPARAAGPEFEPTWLRSAQQWADLGVELALNERVTRLLAAGRTVQTGSGRTLRADAVLVATGGRSRPLGVPGENLAGVHHLRTYDDAMLLRAALRPGQRVVVIGGGFIGTEVAACAIAAGCDVTVVERAPVILERGLGRRWGRRMERLHAGHGVRFMTGHRVLGVGGSAGQVRYVELDDGRTLDADVVVIGVGLIPATELAVEAGAAVAGAGGAPGVIVDEAAATTVPGIWAAGDVTVQPLAGRAGLVRLESWQNAQEQADVAAAGMLGQPQPARSVPWFWSDQYNVNVQIAGDLDEEAGDEVVLRGDPDGTSWLAFRLHAGRLAGVIGLNRGREVRASMRLIARGSLVSAGELADESVDLRRAGAPGRQLTG